MRKYARTATSKIILQYPRITNRLPYWLEVGPGFAYGFVFAIALYTHSSVLSRA